MMKTLSLIVACLVSLLIAACRKQAEPANQQPAVCPVNTQAPQFSDVNEDYLTPFLSDTTLCGVMPAGPRNKWIYRDSFFVNGQFTEVKMDTLYVTGTGKSSHDQALWWGLKSTRDKGLLNYGGQAYFYSTDSAAYFIGVYYNRFPGQIPKVMLRATPWFKIYRQDIVNDGIFIDDMGIFRTTTKLQEPVVVPYGSVSGCIRVQHKAVFTEHVFKPGLGFVKYVRYNPAADPFNLQPADRRQVSELVAFVR